MKDMKNAIFGLIASVREHYRTFLHSELKSRGLSGIQTAHGSILGCLYSHEGQMLVLDIARVLGRSKSSISELVDRLSDLGYVDKVRSDDDRRLINVVLTKKGHAIKKDFDEISTLLINKVYCGFSEQEKDALVNGLLKMRNNLS